jgi:hypothetical protein
MEHVTRIEQELDSFSHTLSLYREQLNHWLSQTADQASHVSDLPSLMGMERIIRFGSSSTAVSSGDDDFISTVVQCPKGGILEIESKFESVYDIPLGNIQVDVIAMDGEKSTPVTLDENGKGQFEGLPGKFYRVHVQGEVAPSKIDELFDSYKGLTTELEGWLRKEWEGFKPQWSQSTFAAAANGIADSRHGQRNYQYDPLNRLTRVRHTRDDLPESFAHDPAGNLLMQDRPGGAKVR